MRMKFWHERWEKGEIGFHMETVNPLLERFWPEAATRPGGRVFVPLCGKSVDMVWLRDQGWDVIGVEASPRAVADFFSEQELEPRRTDEGSFECWSSAGIRILLGDFFALGPELLEGTAVVYDRGALIALPEDMRQRYAAKLLEVLPERARILLLTARYDQGEMSGPPFSVEARELQTLFGAAKTIRRLAEVDALDDHPRFRDQGLSHLYEAVDLVEARGT